jgi:uncharacterized membrane protein YkoI
MRLALVAAISSAFLAMAQETAVKLANLPPAVRAAVEQQRQGGTIRSLSRETEKGKTYYEAELTVNGHNKDVLFDAQGNMVEVEETVELSSVPPAVRATLERESAARGAIARVETLTKNGKLEAYEAQMKKGAKTSEVSVAPDGKLIK